MNWVTCLWPRWPHVYSDNNSRLKVAKCNKIKYFCAEDCWSPCIEQVNKPPYLEVGIFCLSLTMWIGDSAEMRLSSRIFGEDDLRSKSRDATNNTSPCLSGSLRANILFSVLWEIFNSKTRTLTRWGPKRSIAESRNSRWYSDFTYSADSMLKVQCATESNSIHLIAREKRAMTKYVDKVKVRDTKFSGDGMTRSDVKTMQSLTGFWRVLSFWVFPTSAEDNGKPKTSAEPPLKNVIRCLTFKLSPLSAASHICKCLVIRSKFTFQGSISEIFFSGEAVKVQLIRCQKCDVQQRAAICEMIGGLGVSTRLVWHLARVMVPEAELWPWLGPMAWHI